MRKNIIRFYLLWDKEEIFNTFQTLDQMINFLSRLKHIHNKSIIISNGEECFQYENITDNLPVLHKKLIEAMNVLIHN
jgi:hypothetical protein